MNKGMTRCDFDLESSPDGLGEEGEKASRSRGRETKREGDGNILSKKWPRLGSE